MEAVGPLVIVNRLLNSCFSRGDSMVMSGNVSMGLDLMQRLI